VATHFANAFACRLLTDYKRCSHQPTAAGLLLWARRAGDIDRMLQQRRVAGEWGQCHVVSVQR